MGGLLSGVERATSVASGIALLIVTLTIFLNALGRYTVGVTFLGGEELARLLTVWITFIAGYAMLRQERHVAIDLLLRVVPPTVQRLMRGATAFIGTITMAYLAWRAAQLSAFSFGTGQMGTTLPVPRALFFLPVAIGGALMAIAFAETFVRALTGRLEPLPDLVEPTPGAERGDASAADEAR